MPPRQPILLDENALQNALRQKGSLRSGDGVDHAVGETMLSSRSNCVSLKRPLGKILLDENRLQQALQAKAERRKAAEDSNERRRVARSSMDRFINDHHPVENNKVGRTNKSFHQHQYQHRQQKSMVQTHLPQFVENESVINETESMSESHSTIQGEQNKRIRNKEPLKRVTRKKKSKRQLVTKDASTHDIQSVPHISTRKMESVDVDVPTRTKESSCDAHSPANPIQPIIGNVLRPFLRKKSDKKLHKDIIASNNATTTQSPSIPVTEKELATSPSRTITSADDPCQPVVEKKGRRYSKTKSKNNFVTSDIPENDSTTISLPSSTKETNLAQPPSRSNPSSITDKVPMDPPEHSGKLIRRVSNKSDNKIRVPDSVTNDTTILPKPSVSAIRSSDSSPPRPKRTTTTVSSSQQVHIPPTNDAPSTRITTRPPLPPKPKLPSKRSIHTASTTKRSNDSVSTMEDPLSHSSNHSHLGMPSSHSQPQSQSPWNNIPIPNTSDHSQPMSWGSIPIPSASDHPVSFHSQPPSWSVRNQAKTGFSPNQYITQETMTQYTNNLGGVETVATTTKIFHDKAKHDPDLKVFFKKIRWEHVRNEFIILANLQVPDRFDDSIKWILEHHCRLLENGADIDRLVAIWESAIESSWLENRRDDARQLLVGPSRVIFNLKALERHYAMHQKALRAAARLSGKESETTREPTTKVGLLGRLRRGKQ